MYSEGGGGVQFCRKKVEGLFQDDWDLQGYSKTHQEVNSEVNILLKSEWCQGDISSLCYSLLPVPEFIVLFVKLHQMPQHRPDTIKCSKPTDWLWASFMQDTESLWFFGLFEIWRLTLLFCLDCVLCYWKRAGADSETLVRHSRRETCSS